MAAIEQPEVDDLGIRPVELDILGLEVGRISGDIGLAAKSLPAFRSIPRSMRPDSPAQRLEGGDGRIAGGLWRDGQRHLRTDAAAQSDGAAAAHFLAVGDDMRIAHESDGRPRRFPDTGTCRCCAG